MLPGGVLILPEQQLCSSSPHQSREQSFSLAELAGGVDVDFAPRVDLDAVERAGRLAADEAELHVARHLVGRPRARIAEQVPTRAARFR